MMTKKIDKKMDQMMVFCMDDMVPQDHLLRLIDRAIDWSFIYDLVEGTYCHDNGRPSMDPVMLIKIPFIQYLYGIRSMRQTIREIEVNVAYRWFLGLDMMDPVPHFSTFGKNYTRRFKDTDLFGQIFSHILGQCMGAGLVDTSQIFVDATHVKACANGKKIKEQAVHDEALWYEDGLQKEIALDRERHGKRPLRDKDRDDPPSGGDAGGDGGRTRRCSTTDPESGWFRKGEHKHVFAYAVQTACDRNGWILGYTVHPGNEHDSRTFKPLYEKIKGYTPEMVIMDAGYRTPAIAHELLTDGILPLLPYKRPMTKDGFFKKYEYVYDEHYDCYICPEDHILTYRTTDRAGYREYKSCGTHCAHCPSLGRCTHSKSHVKTVTRHVWEEYMEMVEDIRHTRGNREIYARRKETIERIFGTAKEQHGFRYTQYIGRARMEMRAGLTFACMNLKKLARILARKENGGLPFQDPPHTFKKICLKIKERCWSLTPAPLFVYSLKPIEFDRFKAESGDNAFTLTPQQWIKATDAIGIISKSGRYGGTYAHTDIAFEFASWISPEFKLYIIKDYQRLKKEESNRLAIGWDAKRELSKINYRIHTDAVKEFLITPTLSPQEMAYTYASEADILNMALFGKTAAQWRNEKGISGKTPNIRDFASAEELVVLINLEDTNADLIRQGLSNIERLKILREKAYRQLEILRKNKDTIETLKKNLVEDVTKES